MLKPAQTSRFKKDYRKVKKQNRNIEKLAAILRLLVSQNPLPPRNRDHALTGSLNRYRECHIEPDWLLIYRVDGQRIIFERTGSHSELFK